MINNLEIQSLKDISCTNFVKNIKIDSNQAILIYEDFQIEISKQNQPLNTQATIKFQTVPYDCCKISQSQQYSIFIASSKAMPVRIYRINNQTHLAESFGSILSRKQNSQKFLAPIQIVKKLPLFIGGGQKFMAQYDIQKMLGHKYSCMNKTNIASVALMLHQEVLVGSFEGTIYFLDRKTQKISHSMAPHMDSVTSIIPNPCYQNIFATAARKDNYKYIWDRRMLHTFIDSLEDPLYNNQRIGMTWAKNGTTLISGSENGRIVGCSFTSEQHFRSLQKPEQIHTQSQIRNEWQIDQSQVVINSVASLSSNEILFATGTRIFDLDKINKMQPHKVGVVRI